MKKIIKTLIGLFFIIQSSFSFGQFIQNQNPVKSVGFQWNEEGNLTMTLTLNNSETQLNENFIERNKLSFNGLTATLEKTKGNSVTKEFLPQKR